RDAALVPLDGVHMEIVGERTRGEIVRSADAARARIAGPVHRPVHDARLLADVFHDIDLAALRPTDGVDVVSKHPERGPKSLPARNANARLEATVRLREETRRLDARRRVATAPVPAAVTGGRWLSKRRDHEMPV